MDADEDGGGKEDKEDEAREMLCPADEVKRNAAGNCQTGEAGGDELRMAAMGISASIAVEFCHRARMCVNSAEEVFSRTGSGHMGTRTMKNIGLFSASLRPTRRLSNASTVSKKMFEQSTSCESSTGMKHNVVPNNEGIYFLEYKSSVVNSSLNAIETGLHMDIKNQNASLLQGTSIAC